MKRQETGYGHRFTDGDAYIDVITWLYDRRCSFQSFLFSLQPLSFLTLCLASSQILIKIEAGNLPRVQSAALFGFRGELQRHDRTPGLICFALISEVTEARG